MFGFVIGMMFVSMFMLGLCLIEGIDLVLRYNGIDIIPLRLQRAIGIQPGERRVRTK